MVYLFGMGRSTSSQPTPTMQKNKMEEQGTEGRVLAVLAPLNRVRPQLLGTLKTTEKRLPQVCQKSQMIYVKVKL